MFRLCDSCKRNLPLEEFLPERDYVCAECKKREKYRREVTGEIAQAKALMNQLVSDTGSVRSSSAPKLDEMCGEIVDMFGGANKFVARWYEQFNLSLINSPGATRNLQHFLGIFRLISEANKHKREDDVTRMTAEQIESEQKRLLLETLLEAASDEKRKEVATKLFAQLGLTSEEISEHDIVQAIDP